MARRGVIRIGQGDIVAGLRKLGVQAGDTMMAHSSLSAFGHVHDGADTVIDACLQAVGPGGTVAMPTLCQKAAERRFELWDPQRSPSDVGRITEVMRRRPEALRSDHATHSVAAIGPLAERITGSHGVAHGRPGPWGPAAFGHGCPWDALYELGAWYVFFGVTFRVNTTRHYIQSRLTEDRLLQAGWRPGVQDGPGGDLARRLRGWLHEGVWPDYDGEAMEARLAQRGLVPYTDIGAARCRAVRTPTMVDAILCILRSEPDQWFGDSFLTWWRDAGSAPTACG